MSDESKNKATTTPKAPRKPRAPKQSTPDIIEDKASSKAANAKTKTTKTTTKSDETAKTTVKKPRTRAGSAQAKATTKPKTKSTSKSTKTVTESVEINESGLAKQADSNVAAQESDATSKKARRPRSVSKAKAKSSTIEQTVDSKAQVVEDEAAKAKPKSGPKTPRRVNKKTVQEAETSSSIVNEEQSDLSNQAQDESLEVESAAEGVLPKSRRGRRGGRGKRGKKRALKPLEEAVELKTATTRAKPAQATSVAEGKPGRARATVGKKATASSKRRNMFISVVSGEQVEVALTEEGALHEYYLEMLHQMKTKGNIYKGVVHNVDTNLQAAFINYGASKNGFLQIDEIHPEYYQQHHEPGKGKKYPPIQQVIKPGQEILVQVLKEPTGSKGAFLTTWLSLPGRFLVLTPGQEQIGISRKVDSEEERARLRELMEGIEPGAGLGVIVRTVSVGTSKTTLKNDLQYLKRVWKEIRKRGVSESAPLLVYQEPRLAERAIRDYLTDDVLEVWVDNAEMAESLREVVSLLFPRKKDLVRVHSDVRQTLWERFAIQRQLEQIYSREVVLPSGGRLVFDQTEALMAVDINSGKISGKGNFASMALKTNLEAAEAIARHLRLRDIGGQIVIDFIEMRDKSHVREVEKTLRNAMKSDRARHDMGRMSSFGLLEIVRQRTASSALAITMEPCPHCRGTGMRRNLEWQSLQSLREMMRQGRAAQGDNFVFDASPELAMYLLNRKRQRISEIEEQLGKMIEVRVRT